MKMIVDRAIVEQVLEALKVAVDHYHTYHGHPGTKFQQAINDLRAALAQQADTTDPGHEVDVLREHVRHLERRVRQLHAQQDEPVAWRTFDGEGGYDYRTYADNENYAAEWAQRNPRHVGWVEPLYTAPPQHKN